MYLHIGNGKSVKKKKIIGIFDLDGSTLSPITRKYLADAQKRGEVESTNEELPKSFVLYFDDNNDPRICFSQISSVALGGRVGDSEKYDENGI